MTHVCHSALVERSQRTTCGIQFSPSHCMGPWDPRMFLDSHLWTWLSLNREEKDTREKLNCRFPGSQDLCQLHSLFLSSPHYGGAVTVTCKSHQNTQGSHIAEDEAAWSEIRPPLCSYCRPRDICMNHLQPQIPHPPIPTAHPPPFHSHSLAKLFPWWLCYLG